LLLLLLLLLLWLIWLCLLRIIMVNIILPIYTNVCTSKTCHKLPVIN
jgi:hypothetical protein